MHQKIVVCRSPNAGFGDHMLCLFGSWWYAKQTHRTLVVDWRGSRFSLGNNPNCFLDMFKSFKELVGVPVVIHNDLEEFDFGNSYYWNKWTIENLRGQDHVAHTVEEIETLKRLVNSGVDRDESAVIFNQHLPFPPNDSGIVDVIEALKFVPEVKLLANQYLDGLTCKSAKKNNYIALHIRHGNGENIGARCAYWLDSIDLVRQLWRNKRTDMHAKGLVGGRFLDNMPNSLTETRRGTKEELKLYQRAAASVARLRVDLGQEAPVILFTDSEQVVTAIEGLIPNLFRYNSELLKLGAGPLHNFSNFSDQQSKKIQLKRTLDMLSEAQIMQSCNALICIPSGFTIMLKGRLPAKNVNELKPSFRNSVILKLFNKFM
jgi:hypothetical protein